MVLFGSRRRASSAARQPPLDANTAFAASVAARAAAAASRPATSTGLSSAAAAAALRSVTSSPEPVGSIQTKRMVRRGSNSSVGSASIMSGNGRARGASTRGGAMQRRGSQSSMAERTFRSPSPGSMRNGDGVGRQRRGSQSSMTERTFRSPSPGRSRTNSFANASPDHNAPRMPPVPSIPKSHQRSMSVDPPERVYSPPPNGRGGRTNSMDRSTLPPPVSTRKGMRLSDVNESELERSDSQRNKNFSRPRASRASEPTSPTSPTAGKTYAHGAGAGALYAAPAPNTATSNQHSGPDADELAAKMARIQGAQLKPSTQPTITGTTVRPQARPQLATETVMVYDSNSRTFVPQIKTKSAPVEPQSPPLPELPAAAPGTYDPHTRTIVPLPQTPEPALPTRTIVPAVPDTDMAAPARNPARLSPTNSPRSSSYLAHQPSTVRESPEEDVASLETPKSARIIQTSLGPAKSYLTTTQQQTRSSSLDVPSRNTPSVRGRQVSASPSPQRKTHFSASPISHATRHDPLPRDISPAKSALKNSNSPAPSLRATSPLAPLAGLSKGPGSDVSSLYSQDGISVGGNKKKKKSVRVSFDEQPHEIEVPAAASPRFVSRARSPLFDDSDDEDFLKPRPALPTFGSIRKNREVAEKVTEMAPDRHEHSNDHAVDSILHHANGTTKPVMEPMPPVVTSKEAPPVNISDSDSISDMGSLGDYVAANAATVSLPELPEQPAAPAPPIHEEPSERSPVEPIVRDFATAGTTGQRLDPGVPQISLLPPTPGREEFQPLDNRQSAEIVVPGGWAADNEIQAQSAGASTSAPQQDGGSTSAPLIVHSPEEPAPLLAPIDEDTDTDEFSDAAEDPSELEGGFASLDAIAVSPIVVKPSPGESPASPLDGTTSPPDSPIGRKSASNADGNTGTTGDKSSGDWTMATAYWSQLSRQQRQQIERDHMSSDDESKPAPAAATKKVKKNTPRPISTPHVPRSVPAHRDAQPVQPALKKTTHSQPNPAPVESSHSMRRSMRDGGGLSSGSLRSRSSSAQPAALGQRTGTLTKKTMRPQSSGPAAPPTMANGRVSQDHPDTKPILTRPVSSASIKPAPPVVSQRLQKELSHDSDSESSFRKKKRSNSVASGGMSIKRSMRGGPPDSAPAAREHRRFSPDRARKGKGRDSFSIRSLSPTGSIFGRKKAKDVRDSIRGPSVELSSRMTTMRTAQPAKSLRQTRAPAAVQKSSSGSRFQSRFADSDDSDDDAPPTRRGGGGGFRSRFADSDEEDAEVLTPVRGIPRRRDQDDGDSTDLDDSDAGGGRKPFSRGRNGQVTPLVPDPADIDKAMAAARKNLGLTIDPPSTPQKQDESPGSALAQGSLRSSQHPPPARPQLPDINSAKKKGFMGGLLRRNRNSQQSVMTVSDAAPTGGAYLVQQQQTPTKVQATPQDSSYSEAPQSPAASPGRLIRRSSAQPRQRVVRGDSSFSTATAPPMTGDRNGWPMGSVPPVPALPADLQDLKGDGRPATSDGQGVRFSDDVTDSPGSYSARTGRKKKFGMLRRAFGLDD